MRYISTRGNAPELGFADTLLTGLATDGGLYVPAEWPRLPALDPQAGYAANAAVVMAPYVAYAASHTSVSTAGATSSPT